MRTEGEQLTTLELQVPLSWANELADPVRLLEILEIGLEEDRIRQALDLYQRGIGSLGYVAELVNLPERVLIENARRRGVYSRNDIRFLEKDLRE